MRSFSVFLCLSVLACGLLFGPQAHAQGTIVHTVLSNTHGGLFGPEGVPVYNAGLGGPWSTLSVDLNHDGIEDFRVVATGTVTYGFQMEGNSLNAVWSRPTGGFDIGALIVPLQFGTEIGSNLPSSDEWTLTEQGPFGVLGPGFSSYSSAGVVGLFVNMTAYAGLRFSIGANTHYGWIKVQEMEFAGGSGIVYEYAYETRPGVPILAGAIPEPSAWALLFGGGVLMVWLKRKSNERKG